MLNKALIISLMTGSIAFADTVSDQIKDVQNWKLEKVTFNSDLGPFPESIVVNLTDEHKGELVIKLRLQEKTKTYPLSKLGPTNSSTVQSYKKGKGYSLKEDAEISFLGNTITVNLQWTPLHPGEYEGELPGIMLGSYEFVLGDGKLNFKRTNRTDENLLVYTAIYSENTPHKWKFQEVTSNQDPSPFPESIVTEFTDEHTGQVVVKYSDHEPKTYPFSRSGSTHSRSIESYDEGSILKEDAVISFSENIIIVDLIHSWLKSGQATEGGPTPAGYEFVLGDGKLNFKRIYGSDNQFVFSAIYSLDESQQPATSE